jgi:hypothetical protein
LGPWSGNWALSMPLMIASVLFHVGSLAVITETLEQTLVSDASRRGPKLRLALVMGAMTVLVTLLHGAEAAAWALAYRGLGALPDYRAAILYSISAMTSYGNTGLLLKSQWQMMGALESLSGMLLLGLTTAFLFSMIQRISHSTNDIG